MWVRGKDKRENSVESRIVQCLDWKRKARGEGELVIHSNICMYNCRCFSSNKIWLLKERKRKSELLLTNAWWILMIINSMMTTDCTVIFWNPLIFCQPTYQTNHDFSDENPRPHRCINSQGKLSAVSIMQTHTHHVHSSAHHTIATAFFCNNCEFSWRDDSRKSEFYFSRTLQSTFYRYICMHIHVVF